MMENEVCIVPSLRHFPLPLPLVDKVLEIHKKIVPFLISMFGDLFESEKQCTEIKDRVRVQCI